METVHLQCGHCKQLMAIGVEHLGGQVQCPHCKGVVQTPAPAPAPPSEPASPPAVSPMPNMELQQRESIFAGAEASDAVIGETAGPQVELPPSASNAPPAPPPDSSGPIAPDAGPAQQPDNADADLTSFKPRPVYEKSVLALYALIFLVPYALLTTLAILYLLFMQGGRTHPFDMMPDPVPDPKKGGAKTVMRTPHTQPLADHQRTTLGKKIRVGKDGDLEVTPERVVWTEAGDLRLFLRAKNISANTVFQPIDEFWIKFVPEKKLSEPYTYLETKSRNVANVYGADLAFRKSSHDKEDMGSAVLRPEQETTIILTTYQSPLVSAIAKLNDTFTWRVQLRRGFVKYRGKDLSATAVIGVEFTSAQIEGKKS